MIRLTIADDHTIFRQGLIRLLQSSAEIVIVGECGNGLDALAMIRDLKPDIAILDHIMPFLDGIEVFHKVRRERLDTKAILLTAHKNHLLAEQTVKAGISGYVTKDTAFEELFEAIRCVASGNRFISPSLKGKAFPLTERELVVLQLIVEGLSNKMIAERLCVSLKTVDTHRTNIMRKLGLHSTASLVRYAIDAGLAK